MVRGRRGSWGIIRFVQGLRLLGLVLGAPEENVHIFRRLSPEWLGLRQSDQYCLQHCCSTEIFTLYCCRRRNKIFRLAG